MCGFAGQTAFGGIDRAALEPRLARALERLRPRGPDSQQSWFDPRCALANTRLSIDKIDHRIGPFDGNTAGRENWFQCHSWTP